MRCFRRCDWSIRLVSFIPARDPLPSPYKLVFEFLFRFWRCTGREKLAKKCWIDDNLATALVHNSIRALSLSLSRSKTFGYPVRAVGAVNLYHRPGRTCLSESGTAVCIRDHSLALFPFFLFLFIFPSFHLLLFLVYLRAVELRCGVYSHPRVSRHDWHVIRPNQKCCPALLTVAPPSTIDPLSFLLHGQTITALVLSAELLFILYFFSCFEIEFPF